MRVDFDKSNVSFGMAIKSTKQAKEFLEKNLSNKSKELLKTLSEKEVENPININLLLKSARECVGYDAQYKPIYKNNDIFVAQVGNKEFQKNIFSSYIDAIKNAIKYARK
jgi:hypothetical protein